MADSETQPTSAIEQFNNAAAHYEKYSGGCTRELARLLLDLPELSDAGAPGSVVLDNACGTGIVAEELMRRRRNAKTEGAVPAIHVVDPAANMVNIARGKLDTLNDEHGYEISSHVMAGERLDFDENIYTHSITNFGILFLPDGPAGAKEIHRTLRPGRIAVVTSWSDLGYLEPTIKPAQLEVRPGERPYQLPISPDWLSPAYLESILGQGRFHDVNMST